MKTKTLVFILIVFVFGIYTVPGNADDLDWPRWRGPNGDGISNETGWDPEALNGGPKILWAVKLGFGFSNVAIKNNRLYTMGSRDRRCTVFCFNAKTGKEIWQHSLDSVLDPQSTPTIEGKYVYVLSNEGILVVLH